MPCEATAHREATDVDEYQDYSTVVKADGFAMSG